VDVLDSEDATDDGDAQGTEWDAVARADPGNAEIDAPGDVAADAAADALGGYAGYDEGDDGWERRGYGGDAT
jgi:hypothetical protein